MDALGLGTALLISLSWGGVALRWGPALGYLDRPDDPDLKAHSSPAVPLGGVGLYAAFHIGSAIAGLFQFEVLLASTVLLGLGLADDRLSLAPSVRLVVEALAGVLVGVGYSGDWRIVASVAVLVVVAVNAVNLFDGLDGLAASAGMVTAFGAAGLAILRGGNPIGPLILAFALAGFLRWNWHPARLFLGDNGAYVLGGLLVVLIADMSANAVELGLGATALGVYLLDLAVTVVRRLAGRRPLFSGDRNHVYDLLRRRGLSVPRIAALVAGTQAILVTVLIGGETLGTPAATAVAFGSVNALVVVVLIRSGVLSRGSVPQ